MKDILIVTTNPNKLREFRQMLEPLGYRVKSPQDLGDTEEVPETGTTFAENARIKAEHGSRRYHCAAVADDSGLAIKALGGAPGVYSARFMGASTSYALKNQALIEKLKGCADRSASFHCAIALAIPGRDTLIFEGLMKGEIALQPSGANGFGYDPIFYLPQCGVTSAQLPAAEKNAISHRGQAARQLAAYLKDHPL